MEVDLSAHVFCSIWFDGLMSTHSLMLKVVVGKKNVPFLLGVGTLLWIVTFPTYFSLR